jgi:PBP1b-binding outer membrane lipoprotein LpoB
MFLKRLIKRLYIRFLIWNRKKPILKTFEAADEYEKTSATICRKLMSRGDTKFSIAPLSEKRYIINENLGMFIVLEPSNRSIELTNHVYHYSVKMSEKTFKTIAHIFDNKVESIRIKYENDIKAQIEHSLHNVLDKLSQ